PYRLQHLEDIIDADLVDRHLADDWIGIGLQRRAPLRPMLVVLPAGLVGIDVFSGAFLECRYRGGDRGNALGFPLFTRSLPLTRRITAITNLDAQAVCSVAGLGQRDVLRRAQANHLG